MDPEEVLTPEGEEEIMPDPEPTDEGEFEPATADDEIPSESTDEGVA